MRNVNSEIENLKALIDNEFTTITRSIEDLERKKFISDNMSLIESLKEEVAQYFCKMNIQIANLIYNWQIAKR